MKTKITTQCFERSERGAATSPSLMAGEPEGKSLLSSVKGTAKGFLPLGLILALLLISPLVRPAMGQASGSIFIVTEQPQLEQGESNLGGYLRGLGYDVTVNETGTAFHGELSAEQISDLESYDLVIVHRATGSGNYSGEEVTPQWNGLNVPLLLGSAYLGRSTNWGWADGAQARPVAASLTINAPSHPIVAGLGNDLFVRPIDIDHINTTAVGSGTLVASVGEAGLAIAVWEGSGSFNGPTGGSHANRRVFFPLMRYHETGGTAGSFSEYSDNGLDLIATAVEYAMTGDASPPPGPRITSVLPDPAGVYVSAQEGLTITARSPAGIPSGGIVLVVNGEDRSDDLVITDSNGEVSARFENLLPNRYYLFEIAVTDADGLSTERELEFDTLSPQDNFTWEANDWNFDSGQFIDNPGIHFTDDPTYFDRSGADDIDQFVISVAGNDAYRFGSPVGTGPASDLSREPWASDDREDAVQYHVGWVAVGEWLNYTRTFPAGEYFVYARMAFGGSGAFGAQLDRVTSDRSQPDQTTETLGTFRGTATGGWQNYAFAPLVDDNANLATIQLNGVETLRVTAVQGGYNANFYMLVPADVTPPQLVDVQPENGTLFADPAEGIRFGIISETGVAAEGVRLVLNGVDRSGDLSFEGDANEWAVSFDHLQANQEYTAEITVTDLNGVANTFPYTGTSAEEPVTTNFGTFDRVEYSGSIFVVTDQPGLEGGEAGLAGFLRSLGYDVAVNEGAADFRGELSGALIAQLESHDLVIVHRATGSGSYSGEAVTPQWNGLNVPLVLMSSYLARGTHWGWTPAATTGWAGTSVSDLQFVDGQHPIVNGMGTSLFSSPRPYDRLNSPEVGNGHLIAIVPGLGDGTALAVWDEPGFFQGNEGQSHVARRVYFALHNYHETGAWTDISMNGMLLTANVIEYTMTGEVTRVPPEPVEGVPAPSIAWDGESHVISWDGTGVTLEHALEVNGPWEALEGQTSPYTESENTGKRFYRLRQN